MCHRGHYEGLSRCRLVGTCVLSSENFFAYVSNNVCTLGTVTGNFAVNSVFITFRSKRETIKFQFFIFRNSFYTKLLLPLPG